MFTHRAVHIAALLLAGAGIAGCLDLGTGRYELSFEWQDGLPIESPLYVFARVEDRSAGAGKRGPALREAGPSELRPQKTQVIGKVPPRDRRVSLLEIRPIPNTVAPVRYYGLSDPFSTRPRETTKVRVAVHLVGTPPVPADANQPGRGGVRIVSTSGFVSSPIVDLVVLSHRASRVRISNLRTFPDDGSKVFALGEPAPDDAPDGFAAWWVRGWSLGAGDDGPREVFARLMDDNNYESITVSDTVVLDTIAPSAQARVEPEEINGRGPLQVGIVASELLAGPPRIQIEGVPTSSASFAAGITAPSNSYTLVGTQLAAQLPADGRYTLLATLTDRAGNTRVDTPVGHFDVDREPPRVTNLTVTPTRAAAGTEVRIAFQLSEAPGERDDALAVTVGPEQPARCEPRSPRTPLQIVCVYTVTERVASPGRAPPVKAPGVLPQPAGTEGSAHQVGVIGFKPPRLIDAVISPPMAALGSTAYVAVTLDEALLAGSQPELHWSSGAPAFSYLGPSGSSHLFALEVDASTREGEHRLEAVSVVDQVGNATTTHGPTIARILPVPLIIDTAPPQVAGLTIEIPDAPDVMNGSVSPRINGQPGRLLRARFGVVEDRPLSTPPLMRIGATRTGTCASTGSAALGQPWTCTYVMQGDEIAVGTERTESITFDLGDAAGNRARTSTSVLFDFRPPSVLVGSTRLWLEASADNTMLQLAGSVGAVSDGTTVNIAFAVDEPLHVTPLVRTASAAVIGLQHLAGSLYTFWHHFEGSGLMEGDYLLEAVVTDLAMNTATVALDASFRVDTTAPTPPRVRVPNRIVFRRMPFGSVATGHEERYTVEGGPAAVDPRSHIVVRDAVQGTRIGWGRADATGAFPPIRLATADTSSIALAAVDAAGNTSGFDLVRDGRWTVNLGPRAGGGISRHRVQGTPHVQPTLLQLGSPEQGLPELAQPQDASLEVEAGDIWTERFRAGSPIPRWDATATYDSARGQLVLIGGTQTGQQDVWEWNGRYWSAFPPGTESPGFRYATATVYDAARRRVVLFGGGGASTARQDTWEWDGRTWSQRNPSGAIPPNRRWHAMAYDSGRQRVVLFGGTGPGDRKSDTWEWDGESWTERFPAGDLPPGRFRHAMAYDANRRRVVLHGGIGAGNALLADTWEWDGTRWHSRPSSTASHPAFRDHVLVFRSEAIPPRIVMLAATTTVSLEAWEWDGTDWHALAAAGGAPPGRERVAAGYDAGRDRVVVFGGGLGLAGSPGVIRYDDTWEWDGAQWYDATPSAVQPLPRRHHAMAHDTVRANTVVFGGETGNLAYQSDTWLWDGSRWIDATPASASPSPRVAPAFAELTNRSRVVLFGGWNSGAVYDDTWEWDGSRWHLRDDVVARPGRRWEVPMAHDVVRNRLVLFGGHSGSAELGDTWEWDGDEWHEPSITGVSPPARRRSAMAYDVRRGVVVLFGGAVGRERLNDTWEWDGVSWQMRTANLPGATHLPPGRQQHAMVYDPERERVVLFAGKTAGFSGVVDDTWEWDGNVWLSRTSSASAPESRRMHGLAYDHAKRHIVLHGGSGRFVRYDDTWSLGGPSPRQRPGALLSFDWGAAQATAAQVLEVSSSARAGGSGWTEDGTASVAGTVLLAWDNFAGTWVPWTTNAAPADAPDWLAQSTTSTASARRLTAARDQKINLLLRTNGMQGGLQTRPSLSLDYVELTVAYRLPGRL